MAWLADECADKLFKKVQGLEDKVHELIRLCNEPPTPATTSPEASVNASTATRLIGVQRTFSTRADSSGSLGAITSPDSGLEDQSPPAALASYQQVLPFRSSNRTGPSVSDSDAASKDRGR